MLTVDLIIFVLALLFGIFLYWRESKNNYLFRLINKITHSKEQQMTKKDPKGFFFNQPFLIRLIYTVLLVLVIYLITKLIMRFINLRIEYFATIIVGILAGTYFASLIVFANNKMEDGQDIIEETINKGKTMLKDLTETDKKEAVKKEVIKEKKEIKKPKKSARERLKDKGYM